MSKLYRVRRDLPDDSHVQLKATDLPTCKAFLRSISDKWRDLRDMPVAIGEEPYVVKREKMQVMVSQGERIVDVYIVEEA